MKKILLSFSACLIVAYASSQVICKGVSPSNIAGNYTFTWAPPTGGWDTPDFLIPNTFVEDTLMMVDDGTPGLNAQGNPFSGEGCNPLINNLTGKIAVIFRNTCEFGAKAFNAQNAGAVGVIIVNRNPGEWLNMAAGASGANVTIPVVMLDFIDGMDIVAEMQNGPVVMFLGNKTGQFANDIGLNANEALGPKGGMIHSLLAQNGTEFNFEIGAKVTNPGSFPKTNVKLNAKVLNPTGVLVYDNSTSGLSLNAIDTAGIEVYPGQINTLPSFSLNSYPAGTYTLTYTALFDSTTYYAISLLNGGEGYDSETSVTTSGGSGNGLTVIYDSSPILLGPAGVTGLNNLTPGQGYIDTTGVTTTGGVGSGLTLDINAEIIGLALQIDTLTNGLNYSNSSSVSTIALTGYGLGLTVGYTTFNGAIDSLYIVNGGSGYQINDTIQILAGDSTATFTIDSVTIGQILSFTINNSGQGYSVGDTILIGSGSNGSLVVSQISTIGGNITSVTAFDMGQGYSVGDTLQISGGNNAIIVIDSILTILSEELDSSDNSLTFTFTINDSVFSYAKIDPAANSLSASNFYRPNDVAQTFSACTVINDANASRVAATGIYFAATKNSTASNPDLTGVEIILALYAWQDNFTNLNDVAFPANNAWTLNQIAQGFYEYTSDLQGEVVYGAFDAPVVLMDNQRYLACAETNNTDSLFLGFDDQNYTWNTNYYLQPMFSVETDGDRYATGFGSDTPSAIGVGLINENSIGLAETNVIEGVAYPNPTTDKVTVSIEGEGLANLTVTDISGKQVLTQSLDLVNGKSAVSIETLDAGVYIFNLVLENGKTSQFNVVKR